LKRIYLDFNASSPLHPEALAAMLPFLQPGGGANPSSLHQSGRAAKAALEDARLSVASSLRCPPEELLFSSGATESNNLALSGFLRRKFPGAKPPPVAASLIEHSSVLAVFRRLEKEGVKVLWLRAAQDGTVPLEEVERALKEGAALVSLMLANNETGVLQPVAGAAKLAKAAGAAVHCDAVQAYGKAPIDVDELGVDLLSLSAHKAYAPKGIGALYVRKGVLLEPLCVGGGHERGLRPGTENIPAIAAFGRMAQLIDERLESFAAHELALRERLEKGILERVPESRINGSGAPRLPNTSSAAFKGLEAAALAAELDREGLEVSTSSACSSGAGPSHVLKAMGVPAAYALGSVRISNGVFTSEEEIERALELIARCVAKLRS
jgi:cysteine desulfurase